jgi:hypothetical protein
MVIVMVINNRETFFNNNRQCTINLLGSVYMYTLKDYMQIYHI